MDEMNAVLRAGGKVFVGARATESVWRREVRHASVVHFGGHAIDVGAQADAGSLQLRGDGASDGTLTVAELQSLDLSGSTAVLLACDTAMRLEEPGPAGDYSHVPSLGEVLLQAGARSVVGNLWPITEEDARLFAIEFYRAGGAWRGAAALEDARDVLRRRFPELPRRWAAPVWVGAADRGPTGQASPASRQ